MSKRTANAMAGATMHFAAEKGLAEFTSWLNQHAGDSELLDQRQVRAALSEAHEILTPQCNTPIETI